MIDNPNNPKQRQRLCGAYRSFDRGLSSQRKSRVNFLKQYCGHHYIKSSSSVDRIPVNLMEMALSIFVRNLVPKNPQVMISSDFTDLRVNAKRYETAVNYMLKKQRVSRTFRKIALDGCISFGIAKRGINSGSTLQPESAARPTGEPFLDHVQFPNFVFDTSAKIWSQCSLAGDSFLIPTDQLKEFDGYESAARRDAQPSDDPDVDQDGVENSSKIWKGDNDNDDEAPDRTRCVDVYLPKTKRIVTFEDREGDWGRPLNVSDPLDFDSELGPYEILHFGDVPDNIMPLAPAMQLIDLHVLTNKIFNKISRQILKRKTVVAARQGDDADTQRLINAEDGECIDFDDPNAVKELMLGGMDDKALAMFLTLKELFSYLAGNMDALGGLSAMTQTLGQDRLLTESAFKRMDDMQQRMMEFFIDVISGMGGDLYSDPYQSLELSHDMGGGVTANEMWIPEHRSASVLKYNYDIDPYSMQYQSPSTQLAILKEVFGQFVVPLMPMLQQQGITVNLEALLKRVGKLSSMRDLDELIMFVGPPEEQEGGMQQRPMKSPVTSRTNQRVNINGGPGAGRSAQNLLSKLLASSNQGATI